MPADGNERKNFRDLRSDRHSFAVRMEREVVPAQDLQCELPEVLIERILAMIPFPHVLKIRQLSRLWKSKFSFRDVHEPDVERDCQSQRTPAMEAHTLGKCLSQSFQRLVRSFSCNWSVYCPVILGNEGILGYDLIQKRWQRLETNFERLLGTSLEPWLITSCGPLISGVSQSAAQSQEDLLIVNVLTRRWRTLPPRPNAKAPSLLALFSDEAGLGYKAIFVSEEPYEGPYNDCMYSYGNSTTRSICIQIFDSVSCSWTISETSLPSSTTFAWRSCSVHFGGKLYCLSGDDRNSIDRPLEIWVYDLLDETWTKISHNFEEVINEFSGTSVLFDLTRFKLFPGESKLILVLAPDSRQCHDGMLRRDTLVIYELDPETQTITEKLRGPPAPLVASCEHITSDGRTVFCSALDLDISSPIVTCDMKSGQWSCFPQDFEAAALLKNGRWADFSFHMGLNPFVVP